MTAVINTFVQDCAILDNIAWDMMTPLSSAQYVSLSDDRYPLDDRVIRGGLTLTTTPCPTTIVVPEIGDQQVDQGTSLYQILETISEIIQENRDMAQTIADEVCLDKLPFFSFSSFDYDSTNLELTVDYNDPRSDLSE